MNDHHARTESEHKGNTEQIKPAPKGIQNGTENLENAEVRNVVSEITSETASEEGNADGTSAAQAASQAQRAAFEEHKKALIASKPPAEEMVRDINAKLKQEKKYLKTDERKYRRMGDLNNLGKIIARLREINESMATVAHATYELLKKLWLKIVHGIV